MADYIRLYFAEDGTQISEEGFTNPVEMRLRSDLSQSAEVRLYAQADDGYLVTNTRVTPTGGTATQWALAPDNTGNPGAYGDWGATLSLGDVGAGEGGRVYFWAKARATPEEGVQTDTSVTFEVDGVAEAA